jgi:hypothetical protein
MRPSLSSSPFGSACAFAEPIRYDVDEGMMMADANIKKVTNIAVITNLADLISFDLLANINTQ